MTARPAAAERRWRNTPLHREPDARRTRWAAAVLLGVGISCLPIGAYLFEQMKCVQVRYRIEEQRTELNRLLEAEKRLRVRAAELGSPERVAKVAADELGLTRPEPHTLAVVRPVSPTSSGLMARVPHAPAGSR